MAIAIECPHCAKRLKVKDQFAGKVLKCPKCQGAMRIPELDMELELADLPDEPVADPMSSIPDDELVADDTEDGAGWSTPQWDEPEEQPVPKPEIPFPQAPDPLAAKAQAPMGQAEGFTSFGSILDFALDGSMITYVLQWMGLSMLALLVAGAVGIVPFIGPIIAICLVPVIAFITLQGICGGISFLTAQKLAHGRAPAVDRAWDVVTRRALSLTLGYLCWGVLSALLITLIAAIVAGLSNIPLIGQVLGGILLIPTYVGIIVAFTLMLSYSLVPAIIGIEDCTAWEALTKLNRLVHEQRFFLITRTLAVAATLFPACLLTLVLTIVPLAFAVGLCGGGAVQQQPGILSTPLMISCAAILLSGLALGVVLVYVSMALIYCQCRGRALVHS